MSEELIDGIAYVAHPFDGKKLNIAKVKDIIERIHQRHPCLILLNPLEIFSYEEYSKEKNWYTTQLEDCLQLLSKADYLILTGDWQGSRGCMCEWGFAKARRDIQIFDWFNGELHEM